MTCASVSHNCLGECRERLVQCVICANTHKAKDHSCGVTGYNVKMGKICTYVIFKCANYRGKHHATAFRYPTRLKVQVKSWKNKLTLQAKDK